MRVYWEVARRSFRRQSTYRLATAAGLVTNTIFGFARALILSAALAGGRTAGGYDARDAVTYSFLSQGLLMVVSAFGLGLDLTVRIKTGDVAIDLFRPLSFHGYWAATDVGRAAFQSIARGFPPLVVGALFFAVRWPSVRALPVFAVAMVAALCVSFGLRYVLCLSTFWLLDDRGVSMVFLTCASFLGGLYIPLALLPGRLGTVARVLPFSAFFQLPADAWLGKPVAHGLTVAAFWAVSLTAAGALLTRTATSKVVVQGG